MMGQLFLWPDTCAYGWTLVGAQKSMYSKSKINSIWTDGTFTETSHISKDLI